MRIIIVGDTGIKDAVIAAPFTDGTTPVLFVKKDSIPVTVQQELIRLAPTEILVFGGTARVSNTVVTELEAYAPTARIAGASVFSTAIAASRILHPVEVPVELPAEPPVVEPPAPPPVVEPPSGLFIPAYAGNPDVGLTDPSLLTNWTSDNRIKTAQTIRNKRFTGWTPVQADGIELTLINCSIETVNTWFYTRTIGGGKLIMRDCYIGNPQSSQFGISTGGGSSYDLRRVKMEYCEDGIKSTSGSYFEQVHVTKMRSPMDSPHSDCVQISSGGNVEFAYCKFDSVSADGRSTTSAMLVKADFGNIKNVNVHDCYLGGGGYSLYNRKTSSYGVSGFRFDNNVFGGDHVYGFVSADQPFQSFTGNVDVDGNTV